MVEQTRVYVHVRGEAKSKLCIAHVLPFCSLTDTQTFDLKFYTVAGPYAPGREPGVTARSYVTHLNGDRAVSTRFIPE